LFEFVDTVVAALQAEPAQLEQDGTRGRVDEVVAERYLHDRAWALADVDEPWRIVTLPLM
jgi:hypothetical protein